MKLQVLNDYVVVRTEAQNRTTESGLVIPGTNASPIKGTVVGVGNGVLLPSGVLNPTTVEIGDTVLFQSHVGTPFVVDGEEFLVFREKELIAVEIPE